jgi:uncharacterized protein (TIGR02996 family)
VSQRDDLFAAVYAEPDSDDPRIVLADYLMGEGDPRGDFIAKQLAGDHAAADQLLATHGPAWLGSLRPFTNRVQFQRGFPTRLELAEIERPGHIDLAGLVADPALGTIEDLLIGGAHHDVYGALIASSMMTALRRIEVTHPQVLIALRKSRAKITHIAHAVRLRLAYVYDPESLRGLLEVCARRPDVTSLALDERLLDDVIASPLFPRLTAVTLAMRGDVDRVQQQLPRELAATLVYLPVLEPCIAGPHSTLGAIEVDRGGGRLVLRAWGEYGHRQIPPRLQLLPNETRVEIYGTPPESDWLERAARLFKLDLAMLPERPRHGYVGAREIHPKRSAVFG